MRKQAPLAVGVTALGAEVDLIVEFAGNCRIGTTDIAFTCMRSSKIMVHLFPPFQSAKTMTTDYALTVLDDKIFGTNRSTGETMLVINSNGDVSIGGTLSIITSGTDRWALDDITQSAVSPDTSATQQLMPAPMGNFSAWRILDGIDYHKILQFQWTVPNACKMGPTNDFYLQLSFASDGVVDATNENATFDFTYAWTSPTTNTFTTIQTYSKVVTLANTTVTTLQQTQPGMFDINIEGVQPWPLIIYIYLARTGNQSVPNRFTGTLYLLTAQIKYPIEIIGA